MKLYKRWKETNTEDDEKKYEKFGRQFKKY